MLVELQPNKTFKTHENVAKAVAKFPAFNKIRYIIHVHTDGRFFPVFIGHEAITAGVHFQFNVIA